MITAIIILSVITILCLVGWIKNRIALLVLAHIFSRREYPEPTTEELRESQVEVIRNLFKGSFRNSF